MAGLLWEAVIDTQVRVDQLPLMRIYPTLAILLFAGIFTVGCSQSPQTYAANCATPLKHWRTEKDGIGHQRFVQPVYLASDGSIMWNEGIISDAVLTRYMAKMSAMNPEPQVILEVAPAAQCNRVEAVRNIMNAAPICKGLHSLCSEGWNWQRWPEMTYP